MQTDSKVEFVDILLVRNMERKIQNLLNTIKNDPLTQTTFDKTEIEPLNKRLNDLKTAIESNTKDEKMKKVSYDALEKRLKVYLDSFYSKHV